MDALSLAHALLAALLAICPHTPARACLTERTEPIAAAIAAAQTSRSVPAGVMLAVGFLETWAGCHPHEGGGWGAPVDFHHRHTAGTADDAARVLERGFARCHTWLGAAVWFRSGLPCRSPNPVHRAYAERVVRFATRLYAAAGAPLPSALR